MNNQSGGERILVEFVAEKRVIGQSFHFAQWMASFVRSEYW